LDQDTQYETQIIIVNKRNQQHRTPLLVKGINGTNFTYEIYEDTEELDLFGRWNTEKDNIVVVNKCGVIVSNSPLVFKPTSKFMRGFKTAVENDPAAEDEPACLCETDDDDDDDDNDDDDNDYGDDDDDDDNDDDDTQSTPSPSVDSKENKLS